MSAAASWPISYCTLDRSPLFDQPETLHDQIAAAARAGFAYITPDMFSLRAYVEAHGTVEPLAEQLHRLRVGVCDIAGANLSADRTASLAEATELAGYGAALGARWVQTRITAPLDDPTVLDTYRECAAVIDAHGLGVGLEFSPFTPVDSLTRARAVLAAVRGAAGRQGVVVDTWHLFHTDPVDALDATAASDIAFVQLSDVEAGTGPSIGATLNQRALPGEGVAPLGRYRRALEQIGFDGIVSVEVLSEALRAMPVDAYVERLHAATLTALR